ncbi:FAD-dependent oxidoreductase [Amycolatopsis carbonis]|uniref:FAD-dependent oxidoreductase n=1 Tax=Amycolatopsis carbonis TaxID=715471 RepID=A0A9Y2IFX1_9PSEU|nr:FAD-dependent oxidoreductase [Amycolatopsis sp. 2-15]WIX79199.1 FAD-dependent oxidoreductase [Amycolatopsis sp. 2-15]
MAVTEGASNAGTLVVGAGQAGVELAGSLRKLGASGPITLLSAEARLPYQRPPLSKAFLKGELPEERLALRGADFYAAQQIELVRGEWIEDITVTDPERGTGVATTRSGQTMVFDRLALATGGTPRRLRIPGSELTGIHYLRDIDDAVALRHDLDQARDVVVVGGGFVGLEAAAAATAAGKNVTVVEAADRLLARAVAPEVSGFYMAAHQRRGTEVVLSTEVTEILGRDRVTGVGLSDGRTIPADVVVVGIGLVPHTELAEKLGLACAGGIVVDESSRTSTPSVVAAGDCTIVAHPDHGAIRLESVPNAIAQAKTAAATLLGKDAPDAGVPWFWSDQADLKLQIAGISSGFDETVLRGDPGSERFSLFYYRGGRLVAIDAVNAPRDYMAVRKLLEAGRTVPPHVAADTEVALKELLRAA